MIEQLLIKLGFDGKRAVDGIKSTEKAVNGVAEGLGKLGIAAGAMAIVGKYFRDVIEYAYELKGRLSENEAAASRLVHFFDGAGEKMKSWGASTLGFLARIGEAYGDFVNKQKEFVGLLSKEDIEAAKHVTWRGDVERDLLKSKAELLKRIDEIGAKERKFEEDKAKAAFDALTETEKLAALEAEISGIKQGISTLDAQSLAYRERTLEVGYKSVEAEKLRASIEKKANDEAQKQAEKSAEIRKKLTQEIADIDRQIAEIYRGDVDLYTKRSEIQERIKELKKEALKYDKDSSEYADKIKNAKKEEVELAKVNVEIKKQENEFSEWARDFAQDIKAAKENQILANKKLSAQQGEQIIQDQIAVGEREKIVELYGEEFATSLDLMDNDQKRIALANKAVDVEKEKLNVLKQQRTISIDQGNVASMSEFQIVNSLNKLKSELQAVTTAQGGPARNQDLAWIALTNKIATLEKVLGDIRERKRMDELERQWNEKQYGKKSDTQAMLEKLDSLLKVNTDMKTMFQNEGMSTFKRG